MLIQWNNCSVMIFVQSAHRISIVKQV
jgi:hypothetical protein